MTRLDQIRCQTVSFSERLIGSSGQFTSLGCKNAKSPAGPAALSCPPVRREAPDSKPRLHHSSDWVTLRSANIKPFNNRPDVPGRIPPVAVGSREQDARVPSRGKNKAANETALERNDKENKR